MKTFEVTTYSLAGRFGRVFFEGDIVNDYQFQPGIAEALVNRGFLKPKNGTAPRPAGDTGDAPQVVNSFNVEFGYELISALPYAYHLHKQGRLSGTVSGPDTGPFYFFSPKHKISPVPRSWDNMKNAAGVPNIRIHRPSLDWDVWEPPPLKQKYQNDLFVFDRPIVCVCNRINIEWEREAINYFDIKTLRKMFTRLRKKYTVIYFNIDGRKEFYDGVEPIGIGDYQLCKEMGITTIHELAAEHENLSFNTVQLMVMANCERFVTMNGGYSILASYMGGTNIIYSKECKEISPEINSFYRWYHRFGGSRIVHTDTYEGMDKEITTHFIKELPTLNVLIRTHNRPNYFRRVMDTIQAQTYPNIRVWVGYHSIAADKYLIPYKITPVRYEPYYDVIQPHKNTIDYGTAFPSNHYLNHLRDAISESDGFVMFLDDDDGFALPESAERIMKAIKSKRSLVMWRTFAMNRTIPDDEHWKQLPFPRQVSGITFCFHAKYLKQHTFEPYRLADYRLAKELYMKLQPVYINELLTEMLSGFCNMGRGNDCAE